jgi:hypothetical protein
MAEEQMFDVLLVEDNSTDASLSGIAIALRKPRARVGDARNVKHALGMLGARNAPRVAILGYQALQQAAGKLNGTQTVVIGFAPALSDAERQRALDYGVRAIYERPVEWRPFCDALEKMLDDWLP